MTSTELTSTLSVQCAMRRVPAPLGVAAISGTVPCNQAVMRAVLAPVTSPAESTVAAPSSTQTYAPPLRLPPSHPPPLPPSSVSSGFLVLRRRDPLRSEHSSVLKIFVDQVELGSPKAFYKRHFWHGCFPPFSSP